MKFKSQGTTHLSHFIVASFFLSGFLGQPFCSFSTNYINKQRQPEHVVLCSFNREH